MFKLFSTLLLFLCCFKLQAITLKKNEFGELIESEEHLIFESEYGTIRIDPSTTEQGMYFSDGSYIKIDPTISIITRFSALTGSLESISLGDGFSTEWSVPNNIAVLLEKYRMFSDQPNDSPPTPPPIEDCFYGEIKVPCDTAPLSSPNELKISNWFTSSYNYSSDDICVPERDRLNRGYNGHTSEFRCTLGSGLVLVGSSLALIGTCVLDPFKLICAGAATVYVGSIVQYGDATLSCHNSWLESYNEWKNCMDNDGNSDGSGGSDGSGSSGGSDSGSESSSEGGAGGLCSKTTRWQVCTGGGCTYWNEHSIVSC